MFFIFLKRIFIYKRSIHIRHPLIFTLHVGVTSIKARNRKNSKIILIFQEIKEYVNLKSRSSDSLASYGIGKFIIISTSLRLQRIQKQKIIKILRFRMNTLTLKHAYFKSNYLCTSLYLIGIAYVRIFL
jgi:hypothetical protein